MLKGWTVRLSDLTFCPDLCTQKNNHFDFVLKIQISKSLKKSGLILKF